ncbi:MAG: SDR family oxidoreductase [Candidatus Dormibacteraeota bacterium]|nr:SDR family oxidoreductase [Candidatus Dormibacteraeota bacterium]
MTDTGAGASTAPRAVVLVTGAGSGIGRATARLFALRGYRVAVNDLEHERARMVAADLGAFPCAVDVADAAAVQAMVRSVEHEVGRVSVAVCNAGFSGHTALGDIGDELWRRSLRVNLGGCFNIARAVAPSMQAHHDGAIVTVSSELALIGAAGLAHYISAKSAVLGFTKALARELAPWSVRVNCVAPGPTDTPLLSDHFRSPDYLTSLPLGRLGTPEEIAESIVFLAEARWTTGQVLSPNGGAVIQ